MSETRETKGKTGSTERLVVLSLSRHLDGCIEVEHAPEGVRVEVFDFFDENVAGEIVELELSEALRLARDAEVAALEAEATTGRGTA